jgi:hypothetical protein
MIFNMAQAKLKKGKEKEKDKLIIFLGGLGSRFLTKWTRLGWITIRPEKLWMGLGLVVWSLDRAWNNLTSLPVVLHVWIRRKLQGF